MPHEPVASIVDTAFLAMGRQVDEMADARLSIVDAQVAIDDLLHREMITEEDLGIHASQIAGLHSSLAHVAVTIAKLRADGIEKLHERLQRVECTVNYLPLGLASEEFRTHVVRVSKGAGSNTPRRQRKRKTYNPHMTPVRRSARVAGTPLRQVNANLLP